MFRLLILICWLFSTIAAAKVPSHSQAISPAFKQLNLGTGVLFQADSASRINIKDLLTGEYQDTWQVSDQEILSFGLVSHPYWFKFDLDNHSITDVSTLLEVGYSLTNILDIYIVENNLLAFQYNLGTDRPFENKPFPSRAFSVPVEIPAGRTITVYIKAENSGFLQLPMTLWEMKWFFSEQLNNKLLTGILTGIFLLMCCYSLFLFIMLKEARFFFYSAFCLCFVTTLWILKGYASIFFFSSLNYWHDNLLIMSVGLLCLILSMLGEGLKHFKRNRAISLLNKSLFGACVALIISPLVVNFQFALYFLAVVVSFMALSSLIEAGYYWIRGNNLARLFATSWLLFILGMGLLLLNRFAVIPRNDFTEQFVAGSAFLGLIFLALALAHRTSQEKQQKNDAQAQADISNARYFDIFQNAPEGLFTSTLSGEALSANAALCASFGYKDFEDLQANYGGDMSRFYHHENSRDNLITEMLETGFVNNVEIKVVRVDGSIFWALLNLRLSNFYHNEDRIIDGSIVDITQRKKQELRLRYMAQHDQLTGLFNRRKFEECVTQVIAGEQDGHGKNIIFYLDLDQFKVVNDTCGHSVGDKLLQSLTRLLVAEIPKDQVLARLGGDEFGVMLTNAFINDAIELAERLRCVVQDYRFVWGDQVFSLGISIGIVAIEPNMKSFAEVLSLADTACYTAKEQGRNRIYFYSETNSMVSRYQQEMGWVSKLNDALAHDLFELAFQTIKPLTTKSTGDHFEVLLRLRDEHGDLIAPGEFLPAAETYNLIAAIDKWVVEHFFIWLNKHPEVYQDIEKASINLCGQSMADRDVKNHILHCFDKYQIAPEKICFEVTEGQAIRDIDRTLSFMETFRELGCSFALDDFGVGFCSYSYLKRLPIDYLKIDGSFVRDILADETDFAMVRSFSELAKAVGVKTIAEYVESDSIEEKLSLIGIDYVQGFGIAKPRLLEEKTWTKTHLKLNG
ncbi:EAL domain-containing protein [Motilimonas cestriensis]|uniref:EAL domain-containing protein n=1 Tax=Motilimonas cestriensis TaxID=2742685 RepID=A0ABS8W869_9GAMM|nr:EAL domain-containing protein [Motilimonas cestriensis]MCE2595194.1 EAL domain-containing protein [Motilimonas cestriensis]